VIWHGSDNLPRNKELARLSHTAIAASRDLPLATDFGNEINEVAVPNGKTEFCMIMFLSGWFGRTPVGPACIAALV
jgi:hypothetical protein